MALVDDGLIVLPVPAGNEKTNLITFRFRTLQRTVLDSYEVQTELFKEINDLTAKPEQRAAVLAKARQTLERCQEDHERLRTERDDLGKEIAKLPEKNRPSLKAIDNRLALIRAAKSDLLRHVALLEKIQFEENDPRRKEWLIQVEQAKLLEKEGELGQAIAIYKKAPPAYETATLKQHRADLEKRWNPRGKDHISARDFIFKKWPTYDTAGMNKHIKDAMKALEECKKAGDPFGPMKLLKVTEKHTQRIVKELDALKPDVNIDDEKPALLIKELLGELAKLDEATQDYLKEHTKE